MRQCADPGIGADPAAVAPLGTRLPGKRLPGKELLGGELLCGTSGEESAPCRIPLW
ncbi:MAG: hypothetical protein ABIP94_16525 [Planctomycetota bacterium]